MIDSNAMNNSKAPERDLSGGIFIFLDSLNLPIPLASPPSPPSRRWEGMGGDEKSCSEAFRKIPYLIFSNFI